MALIKDISYKKKNKSTSYRTKTTTQVTELKQQPKLQN